MPTSFVVVPQWQGSVSARAMRLIDGAQAIQGDLPASATREIEVPLGPGESLETGVMRYSSLLRVREHLADALTGTNGQVVVIGGDCGVSVPAIERAREDRDLALVWFDAHADLNSPATSPSGAFGGMALRAVLGEGAEGLASAPGLPATRVRLVGARDIDPDEERHLDETGIALLDGHDADAVADGLDDADAVYVHIDLDVLDPAELAGLDNPVPFGLTVAELTAAIAAIRARRPIVGATIAGFSPSSPAAAGDDLGAILRVIGALTRA